MAGRTMTYYKSAAGKASYKKKLAADVKKSTSKAGLAKRAELKRKRNAAIKKNGAASVKGKDYDHGSKKFISASKNRGKSSGTQGDKNARSKKNK
tara:strand:+ start:647 stop:931 length:285 start_codon:yes stop_codon:yes gene_type:complete